VKKTVLVTLAVLVIIAGLSCDRLPSYAQWERRYAGPDFVEPVAIIRAPDSGYAVIAAIRDKWTRATGVWLLRLNDEGDTLWTRCYTIGLNTWPDAIESAPDGGFFISGRTDAKPFLLYTRRDGELMEHPTWPSYSGGLSCPIATGADGTVVMAGDADYHTVFAQRVESSGGQYWARTYSLDVDIPFLRTLARMSGGGYVLGGSDWGIGLSESGDSLWSRDYGSLGAVDFRDACATADSGCLLSGSIYTDSGARIICTKVNGAGEVAWSAQVSDPPAAGWSGFSGSDGSHYVVGDFDSETRYMDRDGIIVKFNSSGGVEWQRELTGADRGSLVSIAESPDGDLVVLGYGGDGLCLVKMTP